MSRVQEKEVVQCKNKKVKTKSKQQKSQAPSPTVFSGRTFKLIKYHYVTSEAQKGYAVKETYNEVNLIKQEL